MAAVLILWPIHRRGALDGQPVAALKSATVCIDELAALRRDDQRGDLQ